MARQSCSEVAARKACDDLAAGIELRAFAERHPVFGEVVREILRRHCPAEYSVLLEIEAEARD